GRGEAPDPRVGLHGPPLAAADVVHELAEARAEVDEGSLRRHPALEELLAEDAPDGVLRAPLRGAEADIVELGRGHGRRRTAAHCRAAVRGNGSNDSPEGRRESPRGRALSSPT